MSRGQKIKRIIRLSLLILFSVVFTLMFLHTGGLLHMACAYGNGFLVEAMLKAGMNPGQTAGFQDWTPLHTAAAFGNADAIKLLIQYGADVESTHSCSGWTPVQYAAQAGKTMAVMALVNTGKISNEKLYEAMMIALQNGKEKTAEYLLISGAYPSRETQKLAEEKGFTELREIMRKIRQRMQKIEPCIPGTY
ncbi:MAG: ankyrin repeat domain-containing protein [Firmicutes bacterium]|nr:ankyrin repeat domain-containing protein [Bacillota bacterium]